MTNFDILEDIANVETFTVGKRIRELPRLEKQYGSGRWRKIKGEPKSASETGASSKLNSMGTKPMESAEKSLRENVISNK
jgi:hypothetical protein